ncbi:PLP-dependent transferase [Microstroma glucosiphilum]|uniref:phosphoserine transaminase n=1 Tax=Pseudomicrostroma glucosiphilum TaxID=1684307 RepID=A0A316UIV7_9BASI|nr:PLP-dependent transferase [Pseudomicrostroma glucosiphilum]PWN23135.1 PLP-dependent transferase [Pseudomicrostroma glucosiphilum]
MDHPTTAPTLDISRRAQTLNLGAGPSSLPTSVLVQSAQDIVDYSGTGMGLIELSHRSGTFKTVIETAEANLRKLLDVPEDYAVIFTQGGGTEQFSATALNLLGYHAATNPGYFQESGGRGPPIDYAITGSWSNKACQEATRLGFNAHPVLDARKVPGANGKFGSIPPVSEWNLSDPAQKPAMLYYCDNETVDGVEFPSPGFPVESLPEAYRSTVPLVADCSSNILSRPIDIRAHSIVFFGAQKNVGPPGVTVVILRRSLVEVHPDQGVPHGGPRIPTTLVYKNLVDNGSLYNTPPMFSIHVSGLVFAKLLQEQGGVQGAAERSRLKAQRIYKLLDDSRGFYLPTVKQPNARSRMNVTFRIASTGAAAAAGTAQSTTSAGEAKVESAPAPAFDEALEEAFVKFCKANGIEQVKGHRSVGGIRTSLYNAVSVEETERLARVMEEFMAKTLAGK